MKQLGRRILLSLAALSPGVVSLTMQEFAVSLAIMLLGITGALSMTAVAMAVYPKVSETLATYDVPKTGYPSLLTQGALDFLRTQPLDPRLIRADLEGRLSIKKPGPGFVTREDRIDMILGQITARWNVSEILQLSDDQARELWLVERLVRATPAEAGKMAEHFVSPNAMLAMRDRVAQTEVA
ncbi:hypothetical protein [Marivita hallyeonensis]|uniref:hypothetical protein n=1 Tax=Marivita hallyeonensis TaxID=996342 RepID=UPI0015B60D79|nr:hypothetical protein [Marivita hallyeonensis]